MPRYIKNIKYNSKSSHGFSKTLLTRYKQYFKDNNLEKEATVGMWLRMTAMFLTYLANWALLAFYEFSLPTTILLIVSFACLTMIVTFTVSHEAVHGTISKKKWVNDLIYWVTFNLAGPNAYLWKIRHNNAHHFFVNIPGSDIDIESTNLIRISPHSEWKPYHRFQHIYILALYSIFTLHWILFKDFKLYFVKSFGNVTDFKHKHWRFIELVLLKAFYLSFMIGIPYFNHTYALSTIIYAFIAYHLFMSCVLLIIFASSHVGTGSHFVSHDEDHKIPHSFFEHQILTSVDFHPSHPVFCFFFGGFNSHVAHHMFPQTSSVHYGPLSKIIKQTALEFNQPYQERSFFQLWKEHFELLIEMGKNPHAGNKFFIKPEKTENSKEEVEGKLVC